MSYTVDANGNLVARGADSFGYDQANRLKTATVGGTASSYGYDGDGKRATKTVGGTSTNYLYDVNASLPVLLDDGTRKYVWGLGLTFAVDSSGNPIVYHTDGLGSVRALTDASGNVVESYQYDEYGVPTSSQGSIDQPFRYTGEQYDPETGLVYLRARYYEPGAGRFASRDLMPGFADAPETINPYSYVGNNPIARTDPSGLIVVFPPRARSGGIKEDATAVEPDPADLLIVAGVGPQAPVSAGISFVAKTAPNLVRHHTIPKEILKDLPEAVARLVRGKRGSPNRWWMPEEQHYAIHRGRGGGLYNDAWKDALGSAVESGRKVTADVVLSIRDELVGRFGLEVFRP